MEGWSREQGERTSYTKNIMSHNVPRLSRDLHLSCTNLRQRAGTLPGLFFFFFHFRHKAKWSALKSCCDQNKKKRNNGNVARRTSEFIRRRESTD